MIVYVYWESIDYFYFSFKSKTYVDGFTEIIIKPVQISTYE